MTKHQREHLLFDIAVPGALLAAIVVLGVLLLTMLARPAHAGPESRTCSSYCSGQSGDRTCTRTCR
jgi:hypothetical protein